MTFPDAGLLSACLRCRTWPELAEFARARAEMLDDSFDGCLTIIAKWARRSGDETGAEQIEFRRDWLRRLVGTGVPVDFDLAAPRQPPGVLDRHVPLALAYDILVNASSWPAAFDLAVTLLEAAWEAVDSVLAMMQAMARDDNKDDVAHSIRRHRDLVRLARVQGPAAAIRRAAEAPILDEPKDGDVWLRIVAELAVAQDADLHAVLDRHPALLSDRGVALIGEVRERLLLDSGVIDALTLEEARLVVLRARRLGSRAARPAAGAADDPVGLAKRLRAQFELTGDPRVLDEAILALLTMLRRARHAGQVDVLLLHNIGVMLKRRFDIGHSLVDIDLAIEAHEFVVRAMRDDMPITVRAAILGAMNDALRARANVNRDRSSVARLLDICRERVRLCAGPDARRAGALGDLAGALLASYEDDQDVSLLDAAEEACREACTLPAGDRSEGLTVRVVLVCVRAKQYLHARPDVDLDGAAREVIAAASTVDWDDAESREHACAMATMVADEFLKVKQLALADAALAILETAVDRAGVMSVTVDILNNLASIRVSRYEVAGDDADLARGVELARLAVSRMGRGQARSSQPLVTLAHALQRQSQRDGDPAPLDEAVGALEQAMAMTDPPSPEIMNNLATALLTRYYGRRFAPDLDRSIVLYEALVEATPPASVHRLGRILGLTNALRMRAAGDGGHDTAEGSTDLERASHLLEQAIAAASPTHPLLVPAHAALGLVLERVFRHGKDPATIIRALRLARHAIDHTRLSSALFETLLWDYLLIAETWAEALGQPVRDERMPWHSLTTRQELLGRLRHSGNVGAVLDEIEEGIAAPALSTDQPEPVPADADLSSLPGIVRLMMEAGQPPRVDLPGVLGPLAFKAEQLKSRFLDGGGTEVLREAARMWRTILRHDAFARVSVEGRRSMLAEAVRGFFFEHATFKDLESLDALVGAYRLLLADLAEDHPWRPVALVDLGRALATRFRQTADPRELDEAFDALADAALKSGDGSSLWRDCLRYLVNIIRLYPETSSAAMGYVRRLWFVDELLGRLPPADDGPEWVEARLVVIAALCSVGLSSPHWPACLARSGALADAAMRVAHGGGGSDEQPARVRASADAVRGLVDNERQRRRSRQEVHLDELLRAAGDPSDPEAARERVRTLRVLNQQVSPDEDPLAWVRIRVALVTDLMRNVTGRRADNLDEAIVLAHEMLPVVARADPAGLGSLAMFPYWALAECYLDRVNGVPQDNVERSLAILRQALSHATHGSPDWRTVKTKLAFTLTRRMTQTPEEDLTEALDHCEQALSGLHPDADRGAWMRGQYMLGSVHLQAASDRARHLELAIEALTRAAEAATREVDEHDWANIHHNLASAWAERPQGDQEDNLERATAHYELALSFFARDAWPSDWAQAQVGLGSVHGRRRRPDPRATLEAAVAAFEAALSVLTREEYPVEWAQAQSGLGLVFIDAYQVGGRPRDPERALRCFDEALRVYTRDSVPMAWAKVAMNTVRSRLLLNDLDAARAHAEQIVGVFSERAHPLDWARAQSMLADCVLAYPRGDPRHDVPAAVGALTKALPVFEANGLLVETRETASALVHLCGRLAREDEPARRRWWQQAAAAYRVAAQAAESLYEASALRDSREHAVERAHLFVTAGVAALAHTDRLDEAVVAFERARARWLGEVLARNRADLDRLATDHPELAERYRAAVARLVEVEAWERRASETNGGLDAADINAGRAEVAETAERIRRCQGFERFLALPDLSDIAAAVTPDRPLVYLVPHDSGCLVLTVHRPVGRDLAVAMDTVDGLSVDEVDRLLLDDAQPYLRQQITDAAGFAASLSALLDTLGPLLAHRLARRLRDVGARGVVLIAGGRLSLLPIHAAAYDHEGVQRCLLDEFDVSYAPSAWALDHGVAAAGGDFAGFADTEDLRFAAVELAGIRALFATHAAGSCAATKAEVLAAAESARYLHFACHGYFDQDDVLESHLLLDAGQRLTLRELLERRTLRRARLVVASACKTAVAEFSRLPDESLGLPAGFLYAGASAVVGTLWSVNDESTALLMIRFYENHLRGDPDDPVRHPLPVPQALRRAQRWLARATATDLADYLAGHESATLLARAARDLAPEPGALGVPAMVVGPIGERPFGHPYFWAPFVLIGV